jgi:hypothetical protein
MYFSAFFSYAATPDFTRKNMRAYPTEDGPHIFTSAHSASSVPQATMIAEQQGRNDK